MDRRPKHERESNKKEGDACAQTHTNSLKTNEFFLRFFLTRAKNERLKKKKMKWNENNNGQIMNINMEKGPPECFSKMI